MSIREWSVWLGSEQVSGNAQLGTQVPAAISSPFEQARAPAPPADFSGEYSVAGALPCLFGHTAIADVAAAQQVFATSKKSQGTMSPCNLHLYTRPIAAGLHMTTLCMRQQVLSTPRRRPCTRTIYLIRSMSGCPTAIISMRAAGPSKAMGSWAALVHPPGMNLELYRVTLVGVISIKSYRTSLIGLQLSEHACSNAIDVTWETSHACFYLRRWRK